jgi:hypothetical protein
MREYTKAEIAKMVGIPPRTVQYWIERGLLVPITWRLPLEQCDPHDKVWRGLLAEERRRGKRMMFYEDAIITLHSIRILQNAGFRLDTIDIVLKQIARNVCDFFVNPIWGTKKELVVCQTVSEGKVFCMIFEKTKDIGRNNPGLVLDIEKLDDDGNFKLPMPGEGVTGYLCIFLGEVKRQATEAAGLHRNGK